MNKARIYKDNMNFIKKNSSALYQTVCSELPLFRDEIELCQNENNLIVKTDTAKCYLHSMYNRDREYKLTLQRLDSKAQVMIIMGIGLGNWLPVIAQHFPDLERLIIIEPSLQVFKEFLHQSSLQKAFSLFKKVSVVVNKDIPAANELLFSILAAEQFGQIEIACSISYRSLYGDYYNEIMSLVTAFVRRSLVNLATQEKLRETWLVNHWRNRKQICLSLEMLIAHVPAYPAILVSAGPSLSKNIELLRDVQNRAVIVAVGSAMTILEKAGIVPHFRMAMDGVKANEKIFNAVDTSNVPLIFSDSLYYDIFPNYKGPKIRMTMTADHLGRYFGYIEKKTLISIASGFSIANVAMNFLMKWGCKKIILMGQDLCYTDNRLHASGSWTDDKQFNIGRIKMLDIHGNEVFTDTPFMGMKILFENLIASYPQIKVINATEGGLPIAGAENKTFMKVLTEDLIEEWDINSQISAVLNNQSLYPNQEEYSECIQIIEEELGHIIKLNNENKEFALQMLEMLQNKNNPSNLHNLIKAVEKRFQQIEKYNFYNIAVIPYLNDKFCAIEKHYEYIGKDKANLLTYNANVLISKCVIIQEQLEFTKALFEEFKGERALNIIFEV